MAQVVLVNDAGTFHIDPNGTSYAGKHLLIDLWGAKNLTDPRFIEKVLRDAADSAGATILHSHFHHFSPNGGVSGMVVLAESHISIHTWPERSYAAVDIFMCGACNPHDALPMLEARFEPSELSVDEVRRGLVEE